MTRRSIFKLLAGAACAAAMEITGLVPSLHTSSNHENLRHIRFVQSH